MVLSSRRMFNKEKAVHILQMKAVLHTKFSNKMGHRSVQRTLLDFLVMRVNAINQLAMTLDVAESTSKLVN